MIPVRLLRAHVQRQIYLGNARSVISWPFPRKE